MTIEVGSLIALGGLILSFLGFQFTRQKEMKTDTQQDAQIKAKLDYIGKGVDDIRLDIKANERQVIQLGERVTRVEESSKQAHRRLDNIEEKGGN